MYQTAIFVINEYMKERFNEPPIAPTKLESDLYCYSRWAVDELIQRMEMESLRIPPHITGRTPNTPLDILDAFVHEMEYYSETSNIPSSLLIFNTAKAVGKDIAMLFV